MSFKRTATVFALVIAGLYTIFTAFLAAPEIEWRWMLLMKYRSPIVATYIPVWRSTPAEWQDSVTIYTMPALPGKPRTLRQEVTTDIYEVVWAKLPWDSVTSVPFVCISSTYVDVWQELEIKFGTTSGEMLQPYSIGYRWAEAGGRSFRQRDGCFTNWGDLSDIAEDGLPHTEDKPPPYGHLRIAEYAKIPPKQDRAL